jgi:hypothetical protein
MHCKDELLSKDVESGMMAALSDRVEPYRR